MANKFGAQMQAFAKRLNGNMDRVVRICLEDIGKEVVDASPVGDPSRWKVKKAPPGYAGGRFKGAWRLGVNQVPTERPDTKDADGDATKARMNHEVPTTAYGHVYWIVNNMPYARRLEYDGHSSQVPKGGMVGAAVLRWQEILGAAIREVKR